MIYPIAVQTILKTEGLSRHKSIAHPWLLALSLHRFFHRPVRPFQKQKACAGMSQFQTRLQANLLA